MTNIEHKAPYQLLDRASRAMIASVNGLTNLHQPDIRRSLSELKANTPDLESFVRDYGWGSSDVKQRMESSLSSFRSAKSILEEIILELSALEEIIPAEEG